MVVVRLGQPERLGSGGAWWGGGLNFLRRTNADFVGIQEMRVVGQDRCHGGMEAARKAKWKIKITPACVTEKGYASAGVAVACRAQFGMFHPQAQGWKYDTTRMQHAHVGAVCRGGIHCVAVYLYNSEGLSERNRGVLLDLARLIRGLRGPWVVMGDWNLSPEVLQASGWVEEVCGKVLCPSMPTCKNSTIDYFVVDRRFVHAVVYVKRLEGFGITPHYPVRMAIRALPRRMMVRRMVAPRKIPAVLPSGCLSAGDYEVAERFQREGGSLGLGREEWRGRMGGWLDAVEGIMCGILGQEGKAAERICGRRHGPRMVWKCALGKPGDDQSFSTKISRSWAKLRGWCHTIRQARNVLGGGAWGGHPLGRAAEVCCRRILAARKWQWREGEDREELQRFVEAFGRADIIHDGGVLTALEQWAEEEAERTARRAAEEAARRYRKWLQEGPAHGLARQHAATKCRGQWVPGRMVRVIEEGDDGIAQVVSMWAEGQDDEGGLGRGGVETIVHNIQYREQGMLVPADVQQEVDLEGARWEQIWIEEHGVAECAWPEEVDNDLSEIDAKRILDAAGTFSDDVGLGWDRLHPKVLRRVPKSMLNELGRIFMAAERMGSWGGMVGVVITALIPKGGGGLRPIGLLPTLVRLWGRIRAKEVQQWESRNERGYLYGGGARERWRLRGSLRPGRRRSGCRGQSTPRSCWIWKRHSTGCRTTTWWRRRRSGGTRWWFCGCRSRLIGWHG